VTTLIENGIKYNRSGGTVTIKVVPMDQWIELQVEDNGPGIPVQDLSKIFNRFYRCDTSRSEPGLGLGLSLAKAIAQAAGGDLTVESEIHQGSRFTVRLPL
jgi:signal transduction histidine kinase